MKRKETKKDGVSRPIPAIVSIPAALSLAHSCHPEHSEGPAFRELPGNSKPKAFFTLYFQNTNSPHLIRTFLEKYISRLLSKLPPSSPSHRLDNPLPISGNHEKGCPISLVFCEKWGQAILPSSRILTSSRPCRGTAISRRYNLHNTTRSPACGNWIGTMYFPREYSAR